MQKLMVLLLFFSVESYDESCRSKIKYRRDDDYK